MLLLNLKASITKVPADFSDTPATCYSSFGVELGILS